MEARALLTAGRLNRVVCDHPNMCHHCGFLVGETKECKTCGVRAHPTCVAFTDDECDACRHDLHSEVCRVCGREDAADDCDARRLIKCLAFHGFEWSSETEHDGVSVPDDVARTLSPEARLTPDVLPYGGTRPMSATLADGRRVYSRPLVVHSWCAQCAFQQVIPFDRPTPDTSAWRRLTDNLCAPSTEEFGTAHCAPACATVSRNPCVFCDDFSGYRTFCLAHTTSTSSRGCATCHWDMRPHLTYRCFHPSCAVRAGMRRVVSDDAGSGMMCDASSCALIKRHNPVRDRRSLLSASTMFWLEACSGIHLGLLRECDADADPRVDYNSARLGSRYVSGPSVATVPLRPRAKRPRTQEAAQHEADADDEDGAEDDERRRRQETQRPSQHAPDAVASLRRELTAQQARFQTVLLRYVCAEMDRLRDEVRRQRSDAPPSDPDAVLQRVCDEIWRRGQREILSFVAALEHLREHP